MLSINNYTVTEAMKSLFTSLQFIIYTYKLLCAQVKKAGCDINSITPRIYQIILCKLFYRILTYSTKLHSIYVSRYNSSL